ncbi:Gamma-aminobutyric acid type B receptor subunit 2 [Holothuria leucospilota]|uniref:Gamma-aminobutyric acid type B receptor subunit 2 n=1 Tax=Holothuria leucospilota TaxID=206669 RepID=A0A9Q1CFQ3_HOLLE|nr:Gamma-aminobutyric acid type B receptor subunit 2 [Holothuria leucospilota]
MRNPRIDNSVSFQSKVYVTSIGYVLVVSTLVARTWKTYNLKVIKATKIIKDWQVYLFIAISLLTDSLCLLAIHRFFPYHITEITLETKEISSSESLIHHRRFVKICAPEDVMKSSVLLLCDKIFLLLAGSYISYEIRTVKVGLLNDSKAFAWSIYNLLICSICGCLLSFLLRDDSKNLFIFTSSLFLVYCCVTIVMISVPKVIKTMPVRKVVLYDNTVLLLRIVPSKFVNHPTHDSSDFPLKIGTTKSTNFSSENIERP